MTRISGSASGVSASAWDTPEMAAELALLQDSQENREANRAERHAAEDAQEHELDQQQQEMRAAADMRLASGLTSGISQMAQGACSLGQAAAMQRQSDNSFVSDERKADIAELGNENAADARGLASEGDQAAQRAGTAGADVKRWEAGGQLIQGAGTATSAILSRIADAHDDAAKTHERAANRARERADDAHSLEQDEASREQRSLERYAQDIQQKAQAASALIANIRA
jgi:hypothetical protein